MDKVNIKIDFTGLRLHGATWVASIPFFAPRPTNGGVMLSAVASLGDKSVPFDWPAEIRDGTLTAPEPPKETMQRVGEALGLLTWN